MNNIKIVTKIENLDNKRSKVYIDQEFAFVLYKGEVSEYKLIQDGIIEDHIYDTIKKEVLPKRAKKRCLALLQKRSYTESKLRQKLEEGYYSREIIDEALEYVKSFHYVDDYDYACQYIFYHKESETGRKMEEKLMMKGIKREILEQAFQDCYDEEEQQETELQQAKKILDKKGYMGDSMEWKEKRKIYAYMLRKGFHSAIIMKSMGLSEYEFEET